MAFWELKFNSDEEADKYLLKKDGYIPLGDIAHKLPISIKPDDVSMVAEYCGTVALGHSVKISPLERKVDIEIRQSIFHGSRRVTLMADGSAWFEFSYKSRLYEISVFTTPQNNSRV